MTKFKYFQNIFVRNVFGEENFATFSGNTLNNRVVDINQIMVSVSGVENNAKSNN